MFDLKSDGLRHFFKLSLIFSFIVFARVHAEDAPKLKPGGPLSKAVFCEALLWAGGTVSHSNPRPTLSDLRRWLRANKDNQTQPEELDFYRDVDVALDVNKPKDSNLAFARIDQLAQDSRDIRSDLTFIGYEFRGNEEIKEARNILISEINNVNPAVMEMLDQRYPRNSWRERLRHATAGLAAILPLALLFPQAGNDWASTLPITAAFWGLAYGYEFWLPKSRIKNHAAEGFHKQIRIMDDALAGQNHIPISIFGQSVVVPTDLHEAFMKVTEGDLDERAFEDTVNASEDLRRGVFQPAWPQRRAWSETQGMTPPEVSDYIIRQRLRYPEGELRFIHFDSVFFVDPKSEQPVWLLFYRAFKQRPKSPRKTRQETEETEMKSFDWGFAGPIHSPVPIPVKPRR